MKLPAGIVIDSGVSSGEVTSGSASARTGASFTGAMVSRKISLAERTPSLAVTLISIAPWKFAGGVPVNCVPSKLSQDGSGVPSASVAE